MNYQVGLSGANGGIDQMKSFILLLILGYLDIDVCPASLPSGSTYLFLLLFTSDMNITQHSFFYSSHTLSLMQFPGWVLHTAWCWTLYHYYINCWTLLIFMICFNFVPIRFYYSRTPLSFCFIHYVWMIFFLHFDFIFTYKYD